MHVRHGSMFTWLWFASVSKNDAGFWSTSQIFCVAKSESCIGQNLSCTEAHIAASAAGTANWWMLSGMLRYAIRTRPDFTYFCTMFENDESCHCLQNGH